MPHNVTFGSLCGNVI